MYRYPLKNTTDKKNEIINNIQVTHRKSGKKKLKTRKTNIKQKIK